MEETKRIKSTRVICNSLNLSLLLISTFLCLSSEILVADPNDYNDCILESMKGVTSDFAAKAIQQSCRRKHPIEIKQIPEVELPSDALRKIEGKASPNFYGAFEGSIYNNNEQWCISSIVIRIIDKNTRKHHDYKQPFYSPLDLISQFAVCPKESHNISFIPFDLPKSYTWRIVSGTGYKRKR